MINTWCWIFTVVGRQLGVIGPGTLNGSFMILRYWRIELKWCSHPPSHYIPPSSLLGIWYIFLPSWFHIPSLCYISIFTILLRETCFLLESLSLFSFWWSEGRERKGGGGRRCVWLCLCVRVWEDGDVGGRRRGGWWHCSYITLLPLFYQGGV